MPGWRLAGNLLLGSQIAWVLRPYIGPADLPVKFLRAEPWRGNFFEATIALNATLLVSFAPIAWVFSQSTDSIAFISCLHLVLWGVGFYFGLRLVFIGARFLGVADRGYLVLWLVLVTLVSLQMITTLRPIVGRSERLLPAEKKFFVNHWLELFDDPADAPMPPHRDAARDPRP